jgi:hypothetical protein
MANEPLSFDECMVQRRQSVPGPPPWPTGVRMEARDRNGSLQAVRPWLEAPGSCVQPAQCRPVALVGPSDNQLPDGPLGFFSLVSHATDSALPFGVAEAMVCLRACSLMLTRLAKTSESQGHSLTALGCSDAIWDIYRAMVNLGNSSDGCEAT